MICGVWTGEPTLFHISYLELLVPHLEEIPEYAVWPACPCSDGQYEGGLLPEQGSRDTVQESEPVGSRSDSLVHWSAELSHSSPTHGGGQCGGRLPLFTPQSRSFTQDRSVYGVIFGSVDIPPTFQYVGCTYSRPVRDALDYSRFPIALALAGGSPGSRVVEGTAVDVPRTGPPLPSTSQDCARGGAGDCHHPMVATPRLVPQSSPAGADRPADVVAKAQRSPHRHRGG